MNKSILDTREDLVLVDAFDAIVNMSDGSQVIYQHQAYIAKIGEDGILSPYNPSQNELVTLYNYKTML